MIIKILDFAYSLYFNLKYLPFKVAVKLPVLISHHVKYRLSKGDIIISNDKLFFGMIRLGLDSGSFHLAKKLSSICIEDGCVLLFHGRCIIDGGFAIAINKGGQIDFGENVHLNANNIVSASSLIKFANNVGTGWNCSFMDWDGHDIVDMNSGKVVNEPKNILIGENCWIGAMSTIMKGAEMAKNTIIPYGNIITKKCEVPYCIFGGMPNHVLKTNIYRADKI